MSLIPRDKITELKTAASVLEVSKVAIYELEKMSVASLINEAANCGETSVICSRYISDQLNDELKSLGYKVCSVKQANVNEVVHLIKWGEE